MKRWLTPLNLAGLLILLMGAWGFHLGSQGYMDVLPEVPSSSKPVSDLLLKLYFATDQGGLEAESRQVSDPGQNLLQVAINEWVAGPRGGKLRPVAPTGLPVPQVYMHSGTAYINLPNAYGQLPIGSTGETQLVVGMARTLLEFAEVDAVRFLLEGKPVTTLGHLDLTQPFTRN